MAISIREVALQSGVSLSTVSQVLNNNVEARIAPGTQERVRAVAAQLGYEPNRLARGLGRRRAETLGLMISGFYNPFYVSVLECADKLAQKAGYQLLVDVLPPRPETSRLRGWPVDGILMWARPEQNLEMVLGPQALAMPVVYLGDKGRADKADAVGFDLYSGAREAALYALSRGYKKIAFLSPHYSDDWRLEPRFCAYDDVCRAAGLSVEMMHSPRPDRPEEIRVFGREMGEEIARRPKTRRPRVIACYNDLSAIAVLHGLRRGGLHVPEDVAVIGFDGIAEGQLLDRALTTVRVPVETLCEKSLQLLLARIEGTKEKSAARKIVVPTTLLAGETA